MQLFCASETDPLRLKSDHKVRVRTETMYPTLSLDIEPKLHVSVYMKMTLCYACLH